MNFWCSSEKLPHTRASLLCTKQSYDEELVTEYKKTAPVQNSLAT